MKNPSSKLMRMRLDLEEFDFDIEYIKGSQNCGADALSRIDFEALKSIPEHSVNKMTLRSHVKKTPNRKTIKNVNTPSVKIKIYEVNSFREVKRFIQLKFIFTDKNCYCMLLKNSKNILKISLSQYINNGKFDLDNFCLYLSKKSLIFQK